MSSVTDARTRLQDNYELERSKNNESHERELQDEKQNYEQQLRSRNDEYNKRLVEIRGEAQSDVRKLKENLYDRYGKIRNNEALALSSEKEQLSRYKDELDRTTERKVDRVEKLAEARVARATDNEGNKVEEALAAQQKSHQREVSELQNELSEYRNSGRDVEREAAEARQRVVQESEGQTVDERNRIVDAYERTIRKLSQKQDELGEHYNQRLSEQSFAARENARTQVRAQKDEFTKIDHDRQKRIDLLEQHFDQEVKNERTRNDRTTNTLISQSSNEKEKALQNKDQTYQSFLKENKTRTDTERTALEQEVRTLKTTGDATKVSPFVVDKIHKNAEERYYQALKSETEVNAANLSAARARDADDRQALQTRYAEAFQNHARESQRGQDVEKRQFLSAYDDLQHLREDEKRDFQTRYSSTVERAENKRALESTVEQKRRRDELDEQRELLRGEKVRAEEELLLRNKSETREWASRYHELRRDFERQLGEIQDAHDIKVTEMRYDFDKKLRDSDRKSTRALDDRVKMYEHQIKQQELAFKEKERFLTEQYEES
jgi:hypothetical protein